MDYALLKNMGLYALAAVVGAGIATGVQLGNLLLGSDPIALRPLAGSFVSVLFGTLSTATFAGMLSRLGRENVAALVSEIGPRESRHVLETHLAETIAAEGADAAESVPPRA